MAQLTPHVNPPECGALVHLGLLLGIVGSAEDGDGEGCAHSMGGWTGDVDVLLVEES